MEAILLCLLLLLFSVVLATLFTEKNTLKDVPGPWLAKYTNLWLLWHAYKGKRFRAVHEAHLKYGRTVRIGPSHVSVASREAISIILGQGASALQKSQFYDAFVSTKPSVFSTRDRQEHSIKRKRYSRSFSQDSIRGYMPIVRRSLENLIRCLDRTADSTDVKTSVDLLAVLNHYTFDVLSDLVFGEPMGLLEHDGCRKNKVISVVDEREHLAAVLGISPILRQLLAWIPLQFIKKGQEASEALILFARECVQKRIGSDRARRDVLSNLLDAYEATNLDDHLDDLTSEAVTLLIAGSDTSATSIAVTLHYIVSNPRIHRQLLDELHQAFPNCEDTPLLDGSYRLPYLECVLSESLRLFGTNAFGLPRMSPPHGIVVGGHHLPGGIEVSVPSWTIQHDEEIWGEDVEEFRPERWLEDPNKVKYLMTFGFGPRACLGKNLAYAEMRSAIATIILRYDITLSSPMLQSTEGFMHRPLGVKVNLRIRR